MSRHVPQHTFRCPPPPPPPPCHGGTAGTGDTGDTSADHPHTTRYSGGPVWHDTPYVAAPWHGAARAPPPPPPWLGKLQFNNSRNQLQPIADSKEGNFYLCLFTNFVQRYVAYSSTGNATSCSFRVLSIVFTIIMNKNGISLHTRHWLQWGLCKQGNRSKILWAQNVAAQARLSRMQQMQGLNEVGTLGQLHLTHSDLPTHIPRERRLVRQYSSLAHDGCLVL